MTCAELPKQDRLVMLRAELEDFLAEYHDAIDAGPHIHRDEEFIVYWETRFLWTVDDYVREALR